MNDGRIRHLSISGAGFFFPFHAGVIQALLEAGAVSRDVLVHGSSSGALVAFGMLNHLDGVAPFSYFMARLAKAIGTVGWGSFRSLSLTNMAEVLEESFAEYPLDKDAYKRLSGRLFVNVTRARDESTLVSEFTSNEDMLLAIRTSTYIPVLFARPKPFRGETHFDGGLSRFLYNFPGGVETLKVSDAVRGAFYTEPSTRDRLLADIHAESDLGWLGAFIPYFPPDKYAMHAHGYDRALAWLRTRRDIPATLPGLL